MTGSSTVQVAVLEVSSVMTRVIEQTITVMRGCGKLDSEANQQLAAQLGIRSIPSLILYKNGQEIARQSGAFPLPQLKAWLRSHGISA